MNTEEKIGKIQISQRACGIVILIAVTFLLCTNLSSYVFYPKAPLLDSSVFRYIGTIMHDGCVPYRDSFDHKGPLIFLINYLG